MTQVGRGLPGLEVGSLLGPEREGAPEFSAANTQRDAHFGGCLKRKDHVGPSAASPALSAQALCCQAPVCT